MKSRVIFDFDSQNNNSPVISAQIKPSDDVRDKIARLFTEKFQYTSNLCLVRFYPSENEDKNIEISPLGGDQKESEKLTENLSDVQLSNLDIAIQKEINKRTKIMNSLKNR